MAEVTNELMYDVLKQLQSDLSGVKDTIRDLNGSVNALRSHMVAQNQDIANIYAILVRHDARLDRIERRLDIAETV